MHKEKLIAVNNHFQLQFEKAQDCFVLLYPEGMVQLNQSAGEIMNQCDGTKNFNQIVETLEKKFIKVVPIIKPCALPYLIMGEEGLEPTTSRM